MEREKKRKKRRRSRIKNNQYYIRLRYDIILKAKCSKIEFKEHNNILERFPLWVP